MLFVRRPLPPHGRVSVSDNVTFRCRLADTTIASFRITRVSPLLATKRVAWMTAFRVVQRRSVLYRDTPLEPQLHKPNRL